MVERGHVAVGDTVIEYAVVRSRRRRKTLSVSVDPRSGVVVAAPMRTPQREIQAFVEKCAGWILRRKSLAAAQPQPRDFATGESLPYLGRPLRLAVEQADVQRPTITLRRGSFQVVAPARLQGEELRVAVEQSVREWYRGRAARLLGARTARWTKLAAAAPVAVLIRDQRRQWASCSADGTVRFSWRLIMAPLALVDYVVVHELVHLRVPNHSAAFWEKVAELMPDYKVRRACLRDLGATLGL